MVSPAGFSGDKHRGRGDIMNLICHLISQEHMTKESSSIMSKSPQSLVNILTSLAAIGTLAEEICF